MTTAIWNEDKDKVCLGDGCPGCGEMRVDHLVWSQEDHSIDCSTCKMNYVLGER